MGNGFELFGKLARNAPEWAERASFSSGIAFVIWALSENAHVLELESGAVLLTDWRPGLSARVHPVVWGKKLACDPEYQRYVLALLFDSCRINRVEALVPTNAPDGVRRWCDKAGFEHEGLLHKACSWRGSVTDGDLYAVTREV